MQWRIGSALLPTRAAWRPRSAKLAGRRHSVLLPAGGRADLRSDHGALPCSGCDAADPEHRHRGAPARNAHKGGISPRAWRAFARERRAGSACRGGARCGSSSAARCRCGRPLHPCSHPARSSADSIADLDRERARLHRRRPVEGTDPRLGPRRSDLVLRFRRMGDREARQRPLRRPASCWRRRTTRMPSTSPARRASRR